MLKKIFFIVLAWFFIMNSYGQQADVMRIETTNDLTIYYPQYSDIDLACGKMPEKTETNVLFCCEAAFTGELLKEFKHSNIAGHHVSGGKFYRGYKCKPNTGCFVFYQNQSKICTSMLLSGPFSSVGRTPMLNMPLYINPFNCTRTAYTPSEGINLHGSSGTILAVGKPILLPT